MATFLFKVVKGGSVKETYKEVHPDRAAADKAADKKWRELSLAERRDVEITVHLQ